MCKLTVRLSLVISIQYLIWIMVSAANNEVTQTPAHQFRKDGESAELQCSHSISTHNTILWYKQTRNQQLQLMAYAVYTQFYWEPEFVNKTALSGSGDKNVKLTFKALTSNDSAVYFCAAFRSTGGGQPAYFGAGTKLTVLEHTVQKPTIKLLNPSIEEECTEKRVTLVCLAEEFYPDHIDLTWYKDDEKIIEGVAKDDFSTPSNDNKAYSISSRLSIPFRTWNQGNTYTCNVTFHHPKEKTKDGTYKVDPEITPVSLKAPKRDNPSDKADKYTRQGRTTMVAYCLFIAKSVLYGLFVIVIVRRQRFVSK